MLRYAIVGSPETVRRGLEEFVELTKADELMIVTSIHDHDARVRSYEHIADMFHAKAQSKTQRRKEE